MLPLDRDAALEVIIHAASKRRRLRRVVKRLVAAGAVNAVTVKRLADMFGVDVGTIRMLIREER